MIIKGTKARNEVIRQYICEKHVNNLEANFYYDAMEAKKSSIASLGFFSVRPAGEYTLKKIEAGAAPKPHSILDKSIKPLEIESAMTGSSREKIEETKEMMCGLVAHRESGKIDGLFLSSVGVEKFNVSNVLSGIFSVKDGPNNRKYLCFNDNSKNLNDYMTEIKKLCGGNESYNSWFVTGDYDVHDLVEVVASYHGPYVSSSGDEKIALIQLSEALMKGAGDEKKTISHIDITTPFNADEFSVIQHGAQYNYVAQIFANEPRQLIVEEVANYALDIALYDGREWTIIRNTSEGKSITEEQMEEHYIKQSRNLKDYYSSHCTNLKWTWDRMDAKAKAYIKSIAKKSLKDLRGGEYIYG